MVTDLAVWPGCPKPLGATVLAQDTVNFSLTSRSAEAVWLVLYHGQQSVPVPYALIELPSSNRVGAEWCCKVSGIPINEVEYGYICVNKDTDPALREMLASARKCSAVSSCQPCAICKEVPDPGLINPHLLLDPYAKSVSGLEKWGERPGLDADAIITPAYKSFMRAQVVRQQDFDWDGGERVDVERARPRTAEEITLIYELHVRGFTASGSSGVRFHGTYEGVAEKARYLRELGVDCVELMPVFEFDETACLFRAPDGRRLLNYWGYSTAGFFAPKSSYAAGGDSAESFKTLVRELHKNGIAVILDVVFNHTLELGADGPSVSWRGIDADVWYMRDRDGGYLNFSGCGNTVSCNEPDVRDFIVDCLRWWAVEYHVDGFRFDLASILTRGTDGTPLDRPPVLEDITNDPVLSRLILIAEPWDAGGLYQVGTWHSWGPWHEWDGRFRDDARHFLKGDLGYAARIVSQLMDRGLRSNVPIRFITCHDGMTLWDLYSYSGKRNEENGEGGRDGAFDDLSWDCSTPDDDERSRAGLRLRMAKNALALLFISGGVPMISAGDERCRSQRGNNNAWCQDNVTTWLDWRTDSPGEELQRFVRKMTSLRREMACLRCRDASITSHGLEPWSPDLSDWSRTAALMWSDASGAVYAAINTHWEPHEFKIPDAPDGCEWAVYEDTSDLGIRCGQRATRYLAAPRSIVILRAIPIAK